MKRTLSSLFVLCVVPVTCAQKPVAHGEIYKSYQGAVVEIGLGKLFSGNGFIVSADGIIFTANHVVATKESKFREYAANIVVVIGNKPYPATPIVPVISDDQVNYDYALLKIAASNLPHVSLGEWNKTDVGDSLTLICNFPGRGAMMIEGTVSNKIDFHVFGPRPVKTMIFQAPVRKGFSGSPIFDSRGLVIGIVDTEVFGISPSLNELRTKWAGPPDHPDMRLDGISLAASITDMINNLDQNLISGLGSGIAIDYAKEAQEKAAKK